ncbi:hypothetical protein [Bifidobacterium tissieri]|uniref:Uncharacterized protein n=1 Tax=Bifidobacterium tissieri TaxID=1630162 RepID=A0A261FJX8_9BIFI|nr:hypothetical protein [Bifidobacterium tissieri]OZG59126.1 hypothetical protein BTIS_0279 [Bifidobacterium tissieri]
MNMKNSMMRSLALYGASVMAGSCSKMNQTVIDLAREAEAR